jgi:hypothetical protein
MFGLLDLFNQLLLARCSKRHVKIAKLEDDAAQTPNICSLVAPLTRNAIWVVKDFRALIKECAHIFNDSLANECVASYSKISNLDSIIFSFQKNVAGFQIPVNNFLLMQVIDRQSDFENKPFDSSF